MNFRKVLEFLVEKFAREKIEFAVMGGLALQTAGIVRTTRDIDLIVLSENVPIIKEIMRSKGYELLHESKDILNFESKDKELGRVDFLLAHRTYAKAMLHRAAEAVFFEGVAIKVLKIEDIIGLKLQASSNDPGRFLQDMADIRALIQRHHATLDMSILREYFNLFDRGKDLDGLLKEAKRVK